MRGLPYCRYSYPWKPWKVRLLNGHRSPIVGVLTDIYYREGQAVERGQPLVLIDPRPFQLALDQAIAQQARDEAELDNARVILERDRTLLAQDSIAQQDVDTQDATVKQLTGVVAADHAGWQGPLNLTTAA